MPIANANSDFYANSHFKQNFVLFSHWYVYPSVTSQLFLMIRLGQPANQAPRSIMPKKTQKTNQIHQTRHQGQSKMKCQTALEPIFCKNCLQNTRKLCLHLKNIRIRFFFGYGDISEFSLLVFQILFCGFCWMITPQFMPLCLYWLVHFTSKNIDHS